VPACSIAVGALTWFLLSRPPSVSTWCELESQRYGTVGQPFHVKVTLRKPLSAQDVHFDLHWATHRREPRGFLTGATLIQSNVQTATLEAMVSIPTRYDLGYVYAVVFVSANGAWADHALAATSEQITVHQESSSPANTTLYPLLVYDENPVEPVVVHESRRVRFCIAVLWLASVAALRRIPNEPAVRGLSTACLLAASWELLAGERVLTTMLRNLILERELYYERHAFQTFATSIVVATFVGLVALTPCSTRVPLWRNPWVGCWIYAGTAMAGLISLHAVDALLAATVMGLSAKQILSLGAAFATLVAALRIQPFR
jgi:hypothetical protein